MECRVNQSSRYGVITAFSGHEYVKYEWRPVPAGCEAEAERNSYLEIEPEEKEPEQTQEVAPISEPVAPPAPEQPPENAEPQPEPKPEKAERKSSRRRK